MFKLIFLLICTTAATPLFLFPQKTKQALDYTAVDSLSKTVKYKNNIYELTAQLTKPYQQQRFKARAIFKWLTENIRYDCKFYNRFNYKGKVPKTFRCWDEKDCDAKKIVWENNYLFKILRKRKAVCQGYAMLFKKMCDIAGLQSEIITGYIRNEYFQVGTPGILDHAWNVIWLDSAYYLLDVTWAAGGCFYDKNGKLLEFRKQFNEYYWLTAPRDFVRNHFPQDTKWVLISNYTKDSFSANPYYLPYELSKIKLLNPNTGIINAKKGDTIHFEIAYTGYFNQLQINSNIFRNPDIWYWDEIKESVSENWILWQ